VTPYRAHIHQAPSLEFSWFAAPGARTLSPGLVSLFGHWRTGRWGHSAGFLAGMFIRCCLWAGPGIILSYS